MKKLIFLAVFVGLVGCSTTNVNLYFPNKAYTLSVGENILLEKENAPYVLMSENAPWILPTHSEIERRGRESRSGYSRSSTTTIVPPENGEEDKEEEDDNCEKEKDGKKAGRTKESSHRG